jgi:VanZ family protein
MTRFDFSLRKFSIIRAHNKKSIQCIYTSISQLQLQIYKTKELELRMWMKHQLRYWLPVYLYAGAIFCLSSISVLPEPEQQFGITISDAAKHVVEYFILSFLLFRAFINSRSSAIKTKAYLLAITLSILYGATDELHQFFVPERVCSGLDIVLDGVGSSLILIREFFN